jgi:hypothetical protein
MLLLVVLVIGTVNDWDKIQDTIIVSLSFGIKVVDDVMKGLSLMSHEVQCDGTITNVKGQRCSIFQSECKIKEKTCKLIIDGGSFTNAIISYVVHALSLSTWRLPMLRCI